MVKLDVAEMLRNSSALEGLVRVCGLPLEKVWKFVDP